MITLLIAITGANVYCVEGEGYLRFESDNKIVYARTASLAVDNGYLVNERGMRITPPVRIAGEDWRITADGRVVCSGRTISEIVLAKFARPLQGTGPIYLSTDNPKLGEPGANGFGRIVPVEGALSSAYVNVRQSTDVDTNTIVLGQISECSENLSRIPLGEAPAPGSARIITAVTIQSALRSARIEPASVEITVPQKATVRRAARTLTKEQIEAFAREWLAENLPSAANAKLGTVPAERTIPTGDFALRVGSHKELQDALIVTVEGVSEGKRLFQTQLVFNTAASAKAAVSLRIGQTVQIVLVSNAVTVEAIGKVQRVAGEQVTVLIEETKATLTGTLRNDGIVEVKL